MTEQSQTIVDGVKISSEIESEIKKKIKTVLDFKEEVDRFSTKSISGLSEIIMGGGISLDVSDVHIETEKKRVRIRARRDGILQDVTTIDEKIYQGLLSRIKLLSGLKINISNRPQDGRFSVFYGEQTVEVRVSTLPSEYGESIVLRLLNPKNLISLDALGLRKDLLALLKKEIEKPNGMIIVTGPTGSGKTTTLYAFLKQLQGPGIKIITIEDPIEYHLDGISQTQVSPLKGYTFASGLRSIVRQDPDVILVGEIRDLETAEIALQSALTGHLVFSTLHTNDAAGTVARLVSLGSSPANIGPAVNLAVAQRLVRKICSDCRELKEVSPEDLRKIKNGLSNLSKNVEIPKIDENLKIPKAKGCKYCNNTGFRGRIGIFEAFLIDDEIENFIVKNPSIADLKEKAVKKGLVTMYQDGLIKVLEGMTTIEELERIAGEE
ncbi:MAG: GspE/PulE family protein [Candidatus Nealsonbacteria bacterium]|nr:GspE/PulE family protein [Candidatus Nealsonbacteria bacterium]